MLDRIKSLVNVDDLLKLHAKARAHAQARLRLEDSEKAAARRLEDIERDPIRNESYPVGHESAQFPLAEATGDAYTDADINAEDSIDLDTPSVGLTGETSQPQLDAGPPPVALARAQDDAGAGNSNALAKTVIAAVHPVMPTIQDDLGEVGDRMAPLHQECAPPPSVVPSPTAVIDRTVAVALEGEPALAPVHVPTASRDPEFYEFPGLRAEDEERLHSFDSTQLANALKVLVKSLSPNGVTYFDIRQELCSIHAVMTARGLLAPAFRLQVRSPRVVGKPKYTADQTFAMLDRQMFDLLWLHGRGKRTAIEDGKYEALFAGSELCLSGAQSFVQQAWRNNHTKTSKVLRLTDYEQAQLSFFQAEDIRTKWRHAKNQADTVIEDRLRKHATRQQSFGPYVNDHKLLWLSYQMVGHYGQAKVAQMFGWMVGAAPLKKATISAKLKTMHQRTA